MSTVPISVGIFDHWASAPRDPQGRFLAILRRSLQWWRFDHFKSVQRLETEFYKLGNTCLIFKYCLKCLNDLVWSCWGLRLMSNKSQFMQEIQSLVNPQFTLPTRDHQTLQTAPLYVLIGCFKDRWKTFQTSSFKDFNPPQKWHVKGRASTAVEISVEQKCFNCLAMRLK